MKQEISKVEMTHTLRRRLDVIIERWAPLLLIGALFVLPVFF